MIQRDVACRLLFLFYLENGGGKVCKQDSGGTVNNCRVNLKFRSRVWVDLGAAGGCQCWATPNIYT